MYRRWKAGRIAGVAVHVHPTTVLLLVWIVTTRCALGGDVSSTLVVELPLAVAFLLGLALHVFATAIALVRQGVRPLEVTLFPAGGVVRTDRTLSVRQEVVAALAGPAASLVAAGALAAPQLLLGESLWPAAPLLVAGPALSRLALANVLIALVSLLPALPLGGGHVLRAVLQPRVGRARAARIAVGAGRQVAAACVLVGLFTSPALMLLGVAIWLGAVEEAAALSVRSALSGVSAARAVEADLRALAPDDSLERALDLVRAGFRNDFPVTVGDRLVGVLTQADLLEGLVKLGRQAPVSDAMRAKCETAACTETLDAVLPRLQASEGRFLGILNGERLVGILTLESVGAFVAAETTGIPVPGFGERQARAAKRAA